MPSSTLRCRTEKNEKAEGVVLAGIRETFQVLELGLDHQLELAHLPITARLIAFIADSHVHFPHDLQCTGTLPDPPINTPRQSLV